MYRVNVYLQVLCVCNFPVSLWNLFKLVEYKTWITRYYIYKSSMPILQIFELINYSNCILSFSTSSPLSHLILLSRVRVVDNSALGAAAAANKPARVIHVYNKTRVGKIGDKVLLAIMGQKKKALIVGVKQYGQRMTPKFDSNNVILLEDTGNPTGTRITVPIPSHLRKREDLAKVFAITSKFVWTDWNCSCV